MVEAPKILFRLDAGKKAGYGHLSRNLALTDTFYGKSCNCEFLIKTEDRKGVEDFIKKYSNIDFKTKFLSINLSNDEDLNTIIQEYKNGFAFLILDHYEHDEAYRLFLKKHRVKWAQFDYKIKEQVFADVLINTNLGVTPNDYKELVDSKTKLCVGERYSIIRKELLQANRQPIKNRILITMGGGKYPKEVLDMMSTLVNEKDFHFDIIGGDAIFHKYFGCLENTTVFQHPEKISKIFAKADAAIVAGGVTSYELAYLGVPLIIVPFAENQKRNALAFHEKKLGLSFENPVKLKEEIEKTTLLSVLTTLKNNFSPSNTIDGKGTERIVKVIIQNLQK